MKLMIKIPRLKERALTEWLRKSFIIRHLRIIGGGNFCNSRSILGILPLFILTLFVASSCEKELDASVRDDGHPILYGYYQEATGLYQESVSVDSVARFKTKVDAYTSAYPDSKQTWYYPEIERCISQRLVTVTITFNVNNGGNWRDSTETDF